MTKMLLKQFQRFTDGQTPPIPKLLTDQDLIGKLKVWKEKTSTSPSGIHLGHYKALIARHQHSGDVEDSPERIKYDSIQSEI